MRYFEVDHPATQAEKRRRLPGPDVTYVGIDLATDDLPGTPLRTEGISASAFCVRATRA